MKKLAYLFAIFIILQSCGKDLGVNNSSPETGGQGGSLARFAISENHLYAVNGTKLKVFDISSNEEPVYKGEDDLQVNVETLFARDKNTLFVGTMQGMYIYDISNPPQINEISRYEHIVSCDPVVANDSHAFVTLRSTIGSQACNRSVNQLDVLDITNLQNPRLIASYPMEHPIGLGLYGDTLLVCDEGIKVMSIENVNDLEQINYQPDIDAVDIIPFNDLMIIATTSGFTQYRFKNGQLNLLSEI